MGIQKERLDQFALNIEFLLISTVQGVALGALAGAASEPLSKLDYQYWPYILSGFLLILTFWSQAIIHSLSFIKWPLDLAHNFLYFLLGLIEFLAFTQLQDPLRWFIFQLIFVIAASVLYFVDLKLIRDGRKNFDDTPSHVALYKHILTEQLTEMKTLIPSGLIFNSLAVFLIWKYPGIFIMQGYHVFIVGIQVLLTIYIMTVSFKSFRIRSKLISNCIK